MFGPDQPWTMAPAHAGKHHMTMVRRAIHVHHIVAPFSQALTQLLDFGHHIVDARGVPLIKPFYPWQVSRVTIKPACGWGGDGNAIILGQGARKLQDIGHMAATVSRMEVGEQNFHDVDSGESAEPALVACCCKKNNLL